VSEPEDDAAAPVTDLQAFREQRAAAAKRPGSPLRLKIHAGKLWFGHELLGPGLGLGLGPQHIEWLKREIARYEQIERTKEMGPSQHRCFTCGKVKWIECQKGHRAWGETRCHFAVEVLEMGTRWESHAGRPAEAPHQVAFVRRARAACGRVTSDSSPSWREVDCSLCLRRRPRAVV
jgi:hypothetical protein